MAQKKNILVFPCGSEIGLDIYSSIRYSTHFNVIGANSVEDHGQFVYDNYIGGVPFADDNSFIPALSKIVKEHHIDAIYPTMDSVITEIKRHESELECRVISSPLATTEICLSKKLTYERLNKVIQVPEIFSPDDIPANAFPVFAKPNVGYSARGTKKLHSQEEVQTFLMGKTDMLVLEYLPGEEFTVDCFTDRHGKLLFSRARKRNRISNGISVNTYFAKEQEKFKVIAEDINAEIEFRGAWFFQVKRNSQGDLVLLEIASRLGGSSLLCRSIGVNFALLSLFDAFDYDVSVFNNDYNVVLDRALASKYKTNLSYDSVYCDYDDCLILNNTVINTDVVAFLYKCLNEHKKIYLLSKHTGSSLLNELKEFRLDHLFDGIIKIDEQADKVNFIDVSERPIFIDDSNAERKNVKERLGIPVFAPEMIDVLMYNLM